MNLGDLLLLISVGAGPIAAAGVAVEEGAAGWIVALVTAVGFGVSYCVWGLFGDIDWRIALSNPRTKLVRFAYEAIDRFLPLIALVSSPLIAGVISFAIVCFLTGWRMGDVTQRRSLWLFDWIRRIHGEAVLLLGALLWLCQTLLRGCGFAARERYRPKTLRCLIGMTQQI